MGSDTEEEKESRYERGKERVQNMRGVFAESRGTPSMCVFVFLCVRERKDVSVCAHMPTHGCIFSGTMTCNFHQFSKGISDPKEL